MSPERPPTTDAEFRVIHGPWPRWVLQLSLIKLAVWGALISTLAIALALIVMAALGLFG
jgi:hypothetical protein